MINSPLPPENQARRRVQTEATFIAKPGDLFPSYATRERLNVPLISVYIGLYLSILAAPFTFSWSGLVAFILLSFITICLGITLCYHRLLAHRSYTLPRPLKIFLALLGCLAFQRGPIWWVACHRLHHSRVDREGDPHSPRFSFIWSHFLWAFFTHPQLDESPETLHALASDLYDDPALRFLEKYYTAINILFLASLFGSGYMWGGWKMAMSMLVWGGLLRIIYGLNITWLVNSAAHIWGYRTYDTPDHSRNNWWVALLTWGEGWHNNHHAHPRLARMGMTWFEFDLTYGIIRCLQWAGLATQVVSKKPNAVRSDA
jgi:stearoyl-CoA desaturase (delta-9 desaturase)